VNDNKNELIINKQFPEKKQEIFQENVVYYAKASRDFNPIHLDAEFAKNTPLGGTVAHGMLVLAYVSEYMTNIFGLDWFTGGSINARFKAPARPGDILSIKGTITNLKSEKNTTLVSCAIQCNNQVDEPVIVGEAIVKVSS
jgi:3-hydroxybutyryl-CoA dehydratase